MVNKTKEKSWMEEHWMVTSFLGTFVFVYILIFFGTLFGEKAFSEPSIKDVIASTKVYSSLTNLNPSNKINMTSYSKEAMEIILTEEKTKQIFENRCGIILPSDIIGIIYKDVTLLINSETNEVICDYVAPKIESEEKQNLLNTTYISSFQEEIDNAEYGIALFSEAINENGLEVKLKRILPNSKHYGAGPFYMVQYSLRVVSDIKLSESNIKPKSLINHNNIGSLTWDYDVRIFDKSGKEFQVVDIMEGGWGKEGTPAGDTLHVWAEFPNELSNLSEDIYLVVFADEGEYGKKYSSISEIKSSKYVFKIPPNTKLNY